MLRRSASAMSPVQSGTSRKWRTRPPTQRTAFASLQWILPPRPRRSTIISPDLPITSVLLAPDRSRRRAVQSDCKKSQSSHPWSGDRADVRRGVDRVAFSAKLAEKQFSKESAAQKAGERRRTFRGYAALLGPP